MGFVAEEIGYAVLTEYSGRGIGTDIVQYATEISDALMLYAWVSEKNRASERCFEKNGFQKCDAKEERFMNAFNEIHYFYCWTKIIG